MKKKLILLCVCLACMFGVLTASAYENHTHNFVQYYDTDYEKSEIDRCHKKVIINWCDQCLSTKRFPTTEPCEYTLKYYKYNDDRYCKHYGYCSKCDAEISEYVEHNVDWEKSGKYYHYRCLNCSEYEPYYEGSYISDNDRNDTFTIKKGKKTFRYIDYVPKINYIDKASFSNNKVDYKRKKDKLYFYGKKKGKCKVTITMASGAKYKYTIKVK